MVERKKIINYIGACVHEGQPIKGVELAPDALRNAGIFEGLQSLNYEVKDLGNISRQTIDPDQIKVENKGKINNTEILDPLLGAIHKQVKEAALGGGFVLTIGGDHSIATGTISAMKEVHPDLKVIWIDAHADIIDPTSSDYPNYHGMPVSHLMRIITKDDIKGFDWLNDKNKLGTNEIVYFGIRDIDKDEKVTLKKHGIKCFTPDHIIKHSGIANCLEKALKFFEKDGELCPIHISFDIDGCDPSLAPGTGTKSRGGIDYREIHYILRRLQQTGRVVSMDLTEINPKLDTVEKVDKIFGDVHEIQGSQTVFFGCELILSLFGRTNLFLDDIE